MTVLLILAAVTLAPAALLLVNGPGEIELMTTPKNLGVIGAEILARPRFLTPVVEDSASVLAHANDTDRSAHNHAAHIPAGMRAGANA